MSKILLESDFLTVDLRSIFNKNTAVDSETSSVTSDDTTTSAKPENTDAELEHKLSEKGITPDVIKKLMTLGEPFKKACKILGFKTENSKGSNPILAFVVQPVVQEKFLNTGLLNSNSFKAIYNAVAKNLVADSEFFIKNDYNIIYCPDLYSKPAKEIEEYLTLQSNILKTSAKSYDASRQLFNRKVFLYITDEEELNIEKRANKIKDPTYKSQIPAAGGAKLNSLELARKISGSAVQKTDTIQLSKDRLTKIAQKLDDLPKQLAAILSLNMSTKSKKAKAALANVKLKSVSGDELTKAFIALANGGVLPKGQLSEEAADTLVDIIMSSVDPSVGGESH